VRELQSGSVGAACGRDQRYLVDKYSIAGTDLVTVGYGKSKLKDPSNPVGGSQRRVQVVNMENKDYGVQVKRSSEPVVALSEVCGYTASRTTAGRSFVLQSGPRCGRRKV